MNKIITLIFLWPFFLHAQISFIKYAVTNQYIIYVSRPLELSNGNFVASAVIAANNLYTNNIYLFTPCGEQLATLTVSSPEETTVINNFVEMDNGDILANGYTNDSTSHSIYVVLDHQTLDVKKSKRTFEQSYNIIESNRIENGIIYQAGSSGNNILYTQLNSNLARNIHLYRDLEDPLTGYSYSDFINFTGDRLYWLETIDDNQTGQRYDQLRCLDTKLQDKYTIGGLNNVFYTNINSNVGCFPSDTLLVGIEEINIVDHTQHSFIRQYFKGHVIYEKEVQDFDPILQFSTSVVNEGILKCVYYDGQVAWFNSFGERIFYSDQLRSLLDEGDMVGAVITHDGGLFAFTPSVTIVGGVMEYALKLVKTTSDYEISDTPSPECFVATEELASDANILLFPNPSKGFIHIESDEVIHQYKICNTSSELILGGKTIGKNFEINSALLPGFYVIQLETSGGWIMKKFLVLE
ncbi:MAG: T9SS type A sorting domain-containing protein [Saprospiraceae bacterium]